VNRRRARWIAAACGALLIAGLRAAPLLPVTTYLWISLASGLLLTVLVGLSWHVAAAWVGRVAATILLALVVGVPMAVTGYDWSGERGTRMPCRRNWGWLPSYLLRASPQRSLEFTVGDARVKLCYAQPAARGRKMIGGPHVPFGRLWRTGANEPTTFRTSGPIVIGGIPVLGGKASLYSVPGPETWEIILNQATGQWGIESEYTEAVRASELGRRVLPSRERDAYDERLNFSVQRAGGDSVRLLMSWETTEVAIPIWPAPEN
jgi:hypothetical protein